jgi:CRP/FNR family cyclic AMP-dependent transcriptional regulator
MVGKEFLQSHALFGGITDDDIKMISGLFKEEQFVEGDYIIKEGEDGDRLYFICKGSVEVLKQVQQAEGAIQERLTVFGTGDTFGEMELIDIQRRSASVRAIEDVSALSLSNRDMYSIYKSSPTAYTMIIMNIAREISRRLRKMDAVVANSLFSAEEGKAEC